MDVVAIATSAIIVAIAISVSYSVWMVAIAISGTYSVWMVSLWHYILASFAEEIPDCRNRVFHSDSESTGCQ